MSLCYQLFRVLHQFRLHSYIVQRTMDSCFFLSIKIDAVDRQDIVFFILCICLPCQNPTPTLPKMQFNHQQSVREFKCVMQVDTNVASSRDERRAAVVL